MNVKNILNCQFTSWYNCFKEVTYKSEIIPLDEEVIGYLKADGLVLPEGCEQKLDRSGLEEDSDDDQVDWSSEADREAKRPCFPELIESIQTCIDKLGGQVFPKLNWSSPKDASWISFDGTLKCSCPGDVLLLLKSSSFCTHDLIEPFIQCCDYEDGKSYPVCYSLILRRWYDLYPGYEFRCFAKNGRVVGISQRHHSSYYDFLASQAELISADICDFYKQNIQGKFPDNSVVFDVYRKQQGIVYLVDFNPFGPVTDSLLYSWEELEAQANTNIQTLPEVRLVCREGVQPSPLQQYGVPVDIVHLTTGADAHKLVDLINMKTQNPEQDDSSDDGKTT